MFEISKKLYYGFIYYLKIFYSNMFKVYLSILRTLHSSNLKNSNLDKTVIDKF